MELKKERRSGRDRRERELGPHSGPEHRRRVEARKPEIDELELSEDEWKRHFGSLSAAASVAESSSSIEASIILARAKN